MSFTGALVVGLIAIVAGAGCVAGTRTGEGEVSPPTAGSGIERCHGGVRRIYRPTRGPNRLITSVSVRFPAFATAVTVSGWSKSSGLRRIMYAASV